MCCCDPGTASAGLAGARMLQWNPNANNAAVPSADGMGAMTATGTATARAITPGTSLISDIMSRIGLVSAAAINSVAGGRAPNVCSGTGQVTQPTGPFPIQRWRLVFDWSISDAVLNTEAKMFVGWQQGVAAPTAVDPATLTNAIGFGCNTGDNTLHFFATDNAAHVQNVNLGASFPIGIGDAYRTVIACRGGNGHVFDWSVLNANTGAQAAGTTASPNQPQAAITGAPRFWRATGPVNAAAVGIDLIWCAMLIDL